MALAITPLGEFGDLPVFGKASNRGVRPWLTPVRIAGEYFSSLETAQKKKLEIPEQKDCPRKPSLFKVHNF